MTEMTTTEAAIREAIARQGPITFRQFMEMALYSAPGAYYASGAGQLGAHGDYFTSPEIHPSFGALVARQVEQVWAVMDRPEQFVVVEMGAGSGAMARDILSYAARWSPDFHRAIRYEIVERNPELARRQQQAIAELGNAGTSVTWLTSEEPALRPASVDGSVLSNELPDAFPVHRVVVNDGEIKEIFVTVRDGRLSEIEAAPSTPALAAYFDRLGFLPPEGARVEVNLDSLAWIRRVATGLRRGAAITIDYGYSARDLYSERHMDGSLLCFYRHTLCDNPYVRVGLQDMTTHVDFTSLIMEAEAAGLQTAGLTTQHAFLSALGIDHFVASLRGAGLRASDYDANRLAIHELMDPDGLGKVKVLIQQKELEGFEPAGFSPDGIRPDGLGRDTTLEPSPLLGDSHMRLNTPADEGFFVDVQSIWDQLMGDDEE